ncbi:hypothetical protein ACFL0M_06505 [Thermodesulfobacteriota bacterium]
MKRITFILLILTVFTTASWSQMGGGMMGRSTQQLYPQSYPQEENDKLDELLRISRGGQLYDDWWKTTIDTEKPKKDYHTCKLGTSIGLLVYIGFWKCSFVLPFWIC